MLADKLEAFDNIRRSLPSGPRRHVPNERSPLRFYGCGKQGVIKSGAPLQPQRLTKNRHSNQSHQCLHSSDQKPSIDPNRYNFLWNKGTRMCRDRIFIQLLGKGCSRYLRIRDSFSSTLAMSLEDATDHRQPKVKQQVDGSSFLNFDRELRTQSEIVNDIRAIQNDNFVPEINSLSSQEIC
ncbi:hypothetical protein TNCV_2741201 [Trichonephila clavipes]|nr:hypothetical protein TNCV_2741201 [Trichonephila clavipes]